MHFATKIYALTLLISALAASTTVVGNPMEHPSQSRDSRSRFPSLSQYYHDDLSIPYPGPLHASDSESDLGSDDASSIITECQDSEDFKLGYINPIHQTSFVKDRETYERDAIRAIRYLSKINTGEAHIDGRIFKADFNPNHRIYALKEWIFITGKLEKALSQVVTKLKHASEEELEEINLGAKEARRILLNIPDLHQHFIKALRPRIYANRKPNSYPKKESIGLRIARHWRRQLRGNNHPQFVVSMYSQVTLLESNTFPKLSQVDQALVRSMLINRIVQISDAMGELYSEVTRPIDSHQAWSSPEASTLQEIFEFFKSFSEREQVNADFIGLQEIWREFHGKELISNYKSLWRAVRSEKPLSKYRVNMAGKMYDFSILISETIVGLTKKLKEDLHYIRKEHHHFRLAASTKYHIV